MSTTGPAPPERLPEPLVEQLDALGVPGLRATRAYADRRIEFCRTPIQKRILSEATGEILSMQDRGAYTLVRKQPPGQDESTEGSSLVCTYHVTRETRLDGEETLHWSFIDDVRNPTIFECDHCGEPVDEHAEYCPHCGNDLLETDQRKTHD